MKPILFIVLLWAVAPLAHPQALPVAKTEESQLEVTLHDPDSTEPWIVRRLQLDETFYSETLSMQIENTSSTAVKSARFYAELFDGRGRLCSTAAFRLDYNAEHRRDPIAPRESRTLISVNDFLAVATQPVRAVIFPIDEEDITGYVIKGQKANTRTECVS